MPLRVFHSRCLQEYKPFRIASCAPPSTHLIRGYNIIIIIMSSSLFLTPPSPGANKQSFVILYTLKLAHKATTFGLHRRVCRTSLPRVGKLAWPVGRRGGVSGGGAHIDTRHMSTQIGDGRLRPRPPRACVVELVGLPCLPAGDEGQVGTGQGRGGVL
ncbi:hypothetical protein DFH27DRAFT_121605 [Peziza echinospora]|nr:hypothetical protein DFH27DRAFT_121605 [Peziza echinospora]